jgi:chromate reductase
MAYNIVTIVGSIRKESLSLKIANALAKLAPASLQLDVTTLQGISFFNQDLEGAPPADWLAFREKLQKSNGVLFVTPEYNRSIPGVLKNAIDVASRPYGKSSFIGKPIGIIGKTSCRGFPVRSSASRKPISTASAMLSTTRAS